MDCAQPKILIFGDSSPSLIYIIWALTNSQWTTAVLPHAFRGTQSSQRRWTLFNAGETFDYCPSLVILRYKDLLLETHEDKKSIFVDLKFDIILGTSRSYRLKYLDPTFIKKFLHRDTVFLVDTTNELSVVNNTGGDFPGHLVKTMWSDIGGIASEDFSYCFLEGTQGRVFMGESSQNIEKGDIQAGQGSDFSRSLITRFCSGISVGKFCIAHVVGQSFDIRANKIIWTNLIKLICFDILSLIFEEADVTILLRRKKAAHMIKGNYREILAIARTLGVQGLPMPSTKDAEKLLLVLALKEKNKMMSCLSSEIAQQKCRSTAKLHLKSIHNLMHEVENKSSGYLISMLHISNKLGLLSPFLESTLYFISLLFTSGNDFNSSGRKLCLRCPQARTLRVDSLSSILSRKSLPVFSLFKRMLPHFFSLSCTNYRLYPLIFMSGMYSSKMNRSKLGASPATDANQSSGYKASGNNKSTSSASGVHKIPNSAQSVSSSLDELVAGTEYYTYNDDFYDANQNLPRKPPNGAVVSESPQVYYDMHSQSHIYHHTGSFHNANCCRPQTTYGYPYEYTYPSNNFNSAPYTRIPNTTTHQMNTNYLPNRYNLVHANASYSSTSVTDNSNYLNSSGTLCKGQSFHHISQEMSKKTSSQKLRESHANLLEMIQFDSLMDKTTSNRYGGDLDTSSTVLLEASNAKSQKNSANQKTTFPTD